MTCSMMRSAGEAENQHGGESNCSRPELHGDNKKFLLFYSDPVPAAEVNLTALGEPLNDLMSPDMKTCLTKLL